MHASPTGTLAPGMVTGQASIVPRRWAARWVRFCRARPRGRGKAEGSI